MSQYSKKILDDYKKKAPLYLEYCHAIRNLLESILKKEGHKYHIAFRIKDVDSLEEKIERKKRGGKIYKKLSDIEDIAGIRIVFYTQNDRREMIKRLTKEFSKKLKLQETFKVSGYRAIHAIVSFTKNRMRLVEYSRFKDLKCEIQLTLILDHAWAEVEHDILYKEGSEIRALDKKQYLPLKGRLENVMNDYVKTASKELEEIVLQIKKLKLTTKK